MSICPGSGHPPEQMEAGCEVGFVCPGLVRHLPLLLCHDRVQCVHLRQPPHVQRREVMVLNAHCFRAFPVIAVKSLSSVRLLTLCPSSMPLDVGDLQNHQCPC